MKTVRVKIAVAVNDNGDWCAYGVSNNDPESQEAHGNVCEPQRLYWVYADLPIMDDRESLVEGKVESVNSVEIRECERR